MTIALKTILKSATILSIIVLQSCGGSDGDPAAPPANNTPINNSENNAPVNNGENNGPVNNAPMVEVTSCQTAASQSLTACVQSVNSAWSNCFEQNDGPCQDDDPAIVAALGALEGEIVEGCAQGRLGQLEAPAVVGRLKNACRSQAASLAWRSFGGPHGAVWANSDEGARACISGAHRASAAVMEAGLVASTGCLLAPGSCQPESVNEAREASADQALDDIQGACAGQELQEIIALTPQTFVARAQHQADCLTASAHEDAGPLKLSCGPANVEADADWPRGQYIQVVLDEAKWGTRCGDGSPYAFQVRLAPEGEPLDRVVIGMQGGGVCVFEADCGAKLEGAPELFSALDDQPFPVGIVSDDPEESPFANWTKVLLPYCTQDVFTGGGVTEELGDISVERYGSVNLRAAVQVVRDVLWKRMDEEGGAGFRPDEIVTLFGGWSAGGYGTIYNYHWFLDDLQWPRTAAFPDAGLALDNGEALGVRALGLVKIPAWKAIENLPPYCFLGDCAIGPVLYNAIAPRLKRVPEQQLLILTNPRDRTQQGDAYFGGEEDEGRWINAVRESYCETRDLNGLNYYITSVSDESVHVVSIRQELWEGEVDGESMRDWFERAINDPESLQDRVEEGDFVDVIDGVEPYPCPLD